MKEYPKYFWGLNMEMQARLSSPWWKVTCASDSYDLLKQKLDDLPNEVGEYDEELVAGVAYIGLNCKHPALKKAYINIWSQVKEKRPNE